MKNNIEKRFKNIDFINNMTDRENILLGIANDTCNDLLEALEACKQVLILCREDGATGINNFIHQAEQAIEKATCK